MSENALTLIQDALFEIGVLAEGETATDAMAQHALRRLKYMLRHWSSKNIRLYYAKEDTLVLTGATSYTVGVGAVFNVIRPTSIRGAFVKSSTTGVDDPIKIITEDEYRRISMKSLGGTPELLWYDPDYPFGIIYLWPVGTGTLHIDSLKPLTDPATLTTSVSFPPEYDEAIVCGLAVRLAPNYGKAASAETVAMALDGLRDIEVKNFAEQVNAVRPEVISLNSKYNIDAG